MKPSFASAYFENHDNWVLPGFKRRCAWNLLNRGHGGGPLFEGGSGVAAGAAASNLWNGKKLVVLHSIQWRQAWSVDQVIRLRELA